MKGYKLNEFSQSLVNPGRVIKKNKIWYAKAYFYQINFFIYLN